MPQVDPELAAVLRRLRAAFGVVEVLEVVDHRADPDQPTAAGGTAEQEGGGAEPSPGS